MRLRSSQFVMLLLLVCSVQVSEGYSLRFIAGPTLHEAVLRDGQAASPSHVQETDAVADQPVLALSESARAAERTPWSMSPPASASAAVASFTGLLRA